MGKIPQKGVPQTSSPHIPPPPRASFIHLFREKALSLMKKLPDPPSRDGPDFHAPSPPRPPIQDKPRRPHLPSPRPPAALTSPGGERGRVGPLEPLGSGLRAPGRARTARAAAGGAGGAAGARQLLPGRGAGCGDPVGAGARREGRRAAREGAGSGAGGEAGARREGESREAGGRGAPRREAEPRTPGLGASAEGAPVQAARTRGPSSCPTSPELASSLWL